MIEVKELPWDKESIDFDLGTYADWTSENGVLARLIFLKENSEYFLNNRYNQNIRKKLALTPKALEPLLQFSHRLENIYQYKIELDQYEGASRYLEYSRVGLIRLIEQNKAIPQPSVVKKMPENFDFDVFRLQLEELRLMLNSSGELSRNLSKLQSSRAQYIKDYEAYRNKQNTNDSICPTCGYDWISREELLSKFEVQEKALHSILEASNSTLQAKLQQVEIRFFAPIKSVCKTIVEKEKASVAYKQKICGLSESQVAYLTQLKMNFTQYQIDLSTYYLQSYDLTSELSISQLVEKVETLYKPVVYDNLTPDLDDLFASVFENDEKELLKLDVKTVQSKVAYLKQQYSKLRLKEIVAKENHYLKEKERFDNATKIDEDLKKLISLYSANVNSYIESISKGIEILFHIYSGRLLQNFHNGLGVFIESDGKSISFKDTPNAEHDVIFSMSSGQLSSLVIAFTMALNHKYAKNPLLMIDDPVQTMDEINVSGFIDLLRHEFSNRQIFISTHEDHTSSYFRYKFGKAKLDTQRINFKNKYSEVQN